MADRMAIVSALDDGAFVGMKMMRQKISCFFGVVVDDVGVSGVSGLSGVSGVSGVSGASDYKIDSDDDANINKDLNAAAAAA